MGGAPKKPATSEEPPKATGWAAKPNARSASLQRALADQKVTDAEWKALGPELQKSQLGAPENRQLLEAFASPNVRFDARAADLSVDHAEVVSHYRAAHRIAAASRKGEATTEQLRQAMVHYRTLFADLLEMQPDSLAPSSTQRTRS